MDEDTRALEQMLDGLGESGEGDALSVGEVVDHSSSARWRPGRARRTHRELSALR